MSKVKLKIPIDSLRKLPDNAEYRAKSGQASAVVKSKDDTVIVYATCDSLQRQCEYYERKSAIYKEAFEEANRLFEEERKLRYNPIKTALVSFLAGAVIGVLLTVIVKLKLKKI